MREKIKSESAAEEEESKKQQKDAQVKNKWAQFGVQIYLDIKWKPTSRMNAV